MQRHLLLRRHLDALATDVDDADAVVRLRAAQHSKRALMLRAVLDAAAEEHPAAYRSAGVERSFTVLAQVQETTPDVFRRVLLHPPVGAWAATTLRHLRSPDRTDRAAHHLRGLGAIAASAAIVADHGCTLSVPVDSGRMVLPMLGTVHLETTQEIAELHHSAGLTTVTSGDATVTLPAEVRTDGPGWRALRRLSTAMNGRPLAVVLDDADPYRIYPGFTPIDELTDDAVDRWRTHVTAAWSLLVRHHEPLVRSINVGLSSIVPLAPPATGMVSSTSSSAFGAAALSLPEQARELAVALVHEVQHSKLVALLELVPLHHRSVDLYFAPWRDDPRPLTGLLHGCFAYFAITQFWRRQRHVEVGPDADLAHFEFARWREAVWQTVSVLDRSRCLTPHGRQMTAGMRATLHRWRCEPVPPEPLRAAHIAALDHWARWRLGNLVVEREASGQLARAWLAGLPCPDQERIPVCVAADGSQSLDAERRRLLRRHLYDTNGSSSPPSAAHLTPSPDPVHPADALLVCGDHASAAELYQADLRQRPDDAGAWSGLAVAHARDERSGRMRALWHCPEVVRAVHGEIVATADAAPDIGSLAAWLEPVASASGVSPPWGPPPFDEAGDQLDGQVNGGSMPKSILTP